MYQSLLEQAADWLQDDIPPDRVEVVSRRAISNAYYAFFHALCWSACEALLKDRFTQDFDPVEELSHQEMHPIQRILLRSFDHGIMKRVCEDLKKPIPPPKLAAHFPNRLVPESINELCKAFCESQQLRHDADYNLAISFDLIQAQSQVYSVSQQIVTINQSLKEIPTPTTSSPHLRQCCSCSPTAGCCNLTQTGRHRSRSRTGTGVRLVEKTATSGPVRRT